MASPINLGDRVEVVHEPNYPSLSDRESSAGEKQGSVSIDLEFGSRKSATHEQRSSRRFASKRNDRGARLPDQDEGKSFSVSGADTVERVKIDAPSRVMDVQNLEKLHIRSGMLKASSIIPSVESSPSRKRKNQDSVSVGKRVKVDYNNEYRLLLNTYIDETVNPKDVVPLLSDSQMGSVTWKAGEKNSFFTGLIRFGKDNVHGLAAHIGSKSPLEVRDYICRLEEELASRKSTDFFRGLLAPIDFPVALQISSECIQALEHVAYVISAVHDRYDAKREREKWGDSWLLTDRISSSLSHSPTNQIEQPKEILAATELLDLEKWLHLSKQIFMNPAPPYIDENWRNLIQPDEELGIYATAFEDLFRLTKSVTKRLIAATLFCCMSRLRAVSRLASTDLVRAKDVRNAAKTIGLVPDGKKFWQGCARRCHLSVFTKPAGQKEKVLSYDEIEQIMQLPRASYDDSGWEDTTDSVNGEHGIDSLEQSARHLSQNERLDPGPNSSSQCASSTDEDAASFDAISAAEDGQERKSHANESEDTFEDAQVAFIEAHDARKGLIEEKSLWELLDLEPPFVIKPDNVYIPKDSGIVPTSFRKVQEWRKEAEFWSEWEVMPSPVPQVAFDINAKTYVQRHPRQPQMGEDVPMGDVQTNVASNDLTSGKIQADMDLAEESSKSEEDDMDEEAEQGLDNSEEHESVAEVSGVSND